MSDLTLRTWRHIDTDQVWEQGLPAKLFRNRTHLKRMISQYRKLKQAEVYLLFKHNVPIALLFIKSVFLDSRTLIGNLLPLFKLNDDSNQLSQMALYQIGTALYDLNLKFDQLILQIPDRDTKVLPGSEPAIYLGDQVYPNRLKTEKFAAADFDENSYLFFKFKDHHIVVVINDNKITEISFLRPDKIIEEKHLIQALTKRGYLAETGIIENTQDFFELVSQRDPLDSKLKAEIISQFSEYFLGKLTKFDLPYEFRRGTDFQHQVWQILAQIPYGSVLSYQEVAQRLTGDPKKANAYARAVGSACGKNPLGIIIPCHRVIGKDRSLTGFAGGVKLKGYLLDLEFMGRARH